MDRLADLDFRRLVWALPVAFALHEAEEWNILEWHREYWINPPQVTEVTVWTWLGFISLVGFLWTALSLIPKSEKATAHLVFPFFIVSVFANAVQHGYLLVVEGVYSPGTATALLLVMPVTIYLTIRALRDGLIRWWYAAILYIAAMPQVIAIAKAGNRMPESLQAIYSFSAKMSLFLWGHV